MSGSKPVNWEGSGRQQPLGWWGPLRAEPRPSSVDASSPWLLVALAVGLAALGGTVYVALIQPTLTRHRPGTESSAIGALKTIAKAQTLYREADMDGNGTLEYAPALSCLVNTGPGRNQDLIDEVLASGTKSGYVFRLHRTPDARFLWRASGVRIPGTTGDRYFGANMAGLIFFSTQGPVRFNPDGSSPDQQLGQ